MWFNTLSAESQFPHYLEHGFDQYGCLTQGNSLPNIICFVMNEQQPMVVAIFAYMQLSIWHALEGWSHHNQWVYKCQGT